MLSVFCYEMLGFMVTPVGYVFAGAFMLLAGCVFFFFHLTYASGDIIGFFTDMTSFLMILIPILTMRSFAEERKSRTDQFLLTAPQKVGSIVAGKFLAASALYTLMMALIFGYVGIVGAYGKIYWSEVLLGFLGFYLLSMCYISVGLFISALSENQVSAAVMTFGAHFLISAMGWIQEALQVEAVQKVLSAISLYARYADMQNARLTFSSVVYFLSFTMLFLFLTTWVIKKRRWSKA